MSRCEAAKQRFVASYPFCSIPTNGGFCTLWKALFGRRAWWQEIFCVHLFIQFSHAVPMLDERLFYFIHGVATMYFFVAGMNRVRREEASRLERLCGYVLLYWCFLETKDLFFYLAPEIRRNYISNLLILIDMTAVTAGCGFVIERSMPGGLRHAVRWGWSRRSCFRSGPMP